jgi:hypothetical protein
VAIAKAVPTASERMTAATEVAAATTKMATAATKMAAAATEVATTTATATMARGKRRRGYRHHATGRHCRDQTSL